MGSGQLNRVEQVDQAGIKDQAGLENMRLERKGIEAVPREGR